MFSGPGEDPASKVRGVRFKYNMLVISHYGFTAVKEIKYSSQHCSDKTMGEKMALYCECCFSNCTKSWSTKLLS